MSSSTEAFLKFKIWKKSRTALKLTLVTKGERPEISRGLIFATDAESWLVHFVPSGKRFAPRLDLNGSSFEVGNRVVEVIRGEDFLVFEEE
jgi:hypothetical protein